MDSDEKLSPLSPSTKERVTANTTVSSHHRGESVDSTLNSDDEENLLKLIADGAGDSDSDQEGDGNRSRAGDRYASLDDKGMLKALDISGLSDIQEDPDDHDDDDPDITEDERRELGKLIRTFFDENRRRDHLSFDNSSSSTTSSFLPPSHHNLLDNTTTSICDATADEEEMAEEEVRERKRKEEAAADHSTQIKEAAAAEGIVTKEEKVVQDKVIKAAAAEGISATVEEKLLPEGSDSSTGRLKNDDNDAEKLLNEISGADGFLRRAVSLEGVARDLAIGTNLKDDALTTELLRMIAPENSTASLDSVQLPTSSSSAASASSPAGAPHSTPHPALNQSTASSSLTHKCTEKGYWKYCRNEESSYNKVLFLTSEPTSVSDQLESKAVKGKDGNVVTLPHDPFYVDKRIRDLNSKQVFLHVKIEETQAMAATSSSSSPATDEAKAPVAIQGWVFEANPMDHKDKILVCLTENDGDDDDDDDEDEDEDYDLDNVNIASMPSGISDSASRLVQHHEKQVRRLSVAITSLPTATQHSLPMPLYVDEAIIEAKHSSSSANTPVSTPKKSDQGSSLATSSSAKMTENAEGGGGETSPPCSGLPPLPSPIKPHHPGQPNTIRPANNQKRPGVMVNSGSSSSSSSSSNSNNSTKRKKQNAPRSPSATSSTEDNANDDDNKESTLSNSSMHIKVTPNTPHDQKITTVKISSVKHPPPPSSSSSSSSSTAPASSLAKHSTTTPLPTSSSTTSSAPPKPSSSSSSSPPPPPSLPIHGASPSSAGMPAIPHPPGMNGGITPPPTMGGGGGGGVPPPPGMSGGIPPPPTMGGGIPPPPGMSGGIPPPPGMNGIPPPPMMGGGIPAPPGMSGGVPPPPMMGGLPPPPGMFGATPQLKPRETLSKPGKPLKKLHWEVVALKEIEGTFWENTLNNVKFDLSEFDELFQRPQRKKKKKKKKGNGGQSDKAEKQISLLDSKREVNISIALNVFKMSVERLCDSITHIELSILTPERLIALIKILPNEEEVEAVRRFKGDPKVLSKPSRFHYELCKINHVRKRLEQVLFMSTLEAKTRDMANNIRLIRKSLSEILRNKSLRSILHLILTVGNYMNFGDRKKGNCYAFHITALLKLNMTKSTQGLSLMDWIVEHLARHENRDEARRILNFTKTFRDLGGTKGRGEGKHSNLDAAGNPIKAAVLNIDEAAKVDCELILQGLSALRAKLKELGKDLKKMAHEEQKAKEEYKRRKSSMMVAAAAMPGPNLRNNTDNNSSTSLTAPLSSPNTATNSPSSTANHTREPSPVPINHFYKAMVTQFIGAAKKSKQLEKVYNEMRAKFNDVKKFLAIEDIDKPEDLLQIFSEFFAMFDQAVFDMKNRERRRRRERLKAKAEAERSANKSRSRSQASFDRSASSPNVNGLR